MRVLGSEPWLRIWRQNVGGGALAKGGYFTSGIPEGAADLSGVTFRGRRLEIETKSSKGKLNEAQKNWRALMQHFGVIYIPTSPSKHLTVLENVDDVVLEVMRICAPGH